jgi:hypothetical protein
MAMATSRSRLGLVVGAIRALVRLGFRIVAPAGRTMFASVPVPSATLAEPWQVSIATLVSSHPHVPSIAGRLLRRLDKFGSVTIGPARVGFDGRTVRWNRILEIRAYPTANHVPPSVVIDRESDRVREILPPIPGRRWIVRKVADAAVTMLAAFTRPSGPSTQTVPLLPCEIVYRNVFGRRASLPAGLFAATVLTLIPEASSSLITLAADRGIPVRGTRDQASERRAARSHHVRRIATRATTRIRTT